MEEEVARWVWDGEPEASELVLVEWDEEQEQEGEMVDGVQHGALEALLGQCGLHGEQAEEVWQSLELEEEEGVPWPGVLTQGWAGGQGVHGVLGPGVT